MRHCRRLRGRYGFRGCYRLRGLCSSTARCRGYSGGRGCKGSDGAIGGRIVALVKVDEGTVSSVVCAIAEVAEAFVGEDVAGCVVILK